MSTDLTNTTSTLIAEDADDLARRRSLALAESARLRTRAASALEMADFWDEVADVICRRLDGPVSLLPSTPADEPAELSAPELPVEAQAHAAAVAEQAKAGRDPYDPSTLPDLPPFATGRVKVPGDFPSADLRISAAGWTGPAVENGVVR